MKLIDTKTFRTKVLLIILAFVGFLIVLLWFLQIYFLENYYQFAKERSVRYNAKQIETLVSQYPLTEITDIIEEVAFNGSLCVEVRDMEGKPLYVMDMAGKDCVIHGNKSLLASQLVHLFYRHGGIELARTISSYKFESTSFLLIKKIKDYRDSDCLLWVSAPLVPVKSTKDILQEQLVVIIVILLATAIFLSLLLSRFLTKPIDRISQAAKEVSRGNFDVEIPISGRDEISQMAKNFNFMVSEIGNVESTRRALFANISHDLRTPLTMIKGYAETIKEISGNNPEKRDMHLDIIIRESDRLSLLVDDVLHYTTISQEGYALEQVQFDVGRMLRDIVERYSMLKNKDYSIVYFGKNSCSVWGDPKRVEQVICNLLNNAIRHMGEDKQIILDLVLMHNHCRIVVSDHGPGIPEGHLPLIWDRYYQVDKSGKQHAHGTGLGLSIVKAIVQAHGTSYGVQSVEGKGSDFWFELKLDE